MLQSTGPDGLLTPFLHRWPCTQQGGAKHQAARQLWENVTGWRGRSTVITWLLMLPPVQEVLQSTDSEMGEAEGRRLPKRSLKFHLFFLFFFFFQIFNKYFLSFLSFFLYFVWLCWVFIAVRGFLIVVASLAAEHGL